MNLSPLLQRLTVQNPEQLMARAAETAPFWASLLLVVAIAWYAARLVWLMVPDPPAAAWAPPAFTGIPQLSAAAGDVSVYAGISAAHLFGQPAAAPDPSAAVAADAPETQLDLQLRGVVAAADPRFAHAIVADGSGNEKVYFVEDPLPGGALLQRIQPDRVILSRGGIMEALLLPRESGDGSSAPAPRPAVQPLARRPQTASMQDVLTENATGFTEIIRPQPFMPNGELKGYRIYPGRNREQFVNLGLQPGDLVTEINGMTLNNPAQAMELFRSLANTSQVTVTLERDGQAQTLTLDTNQVAAAGGVTQ